MRFELEGPAGLRRFRRREASREIAADAYRSAASHATGNGVAP
jgi:hypothetical protein